MILYCVLHLAFHCLLKEWKTNYDFLYLYFPKAVQSFQLLLLVWNSNDIDTSLGLVILKQTKFYFLYFHVNFILVTYASFLYKAEYYYF